MGCFLDTVETIMPGKGFPYFGGLHRMWLALFLAVTVWSCLVYRRSSWRRRRKWQRIVTALLILDELFKVVMLVIGGNFMLKYLPLHLCSINIFLIAFHTWHPTKVIGNFLYLVSIPGALAALLFPSWASLPLGNFMHLHSFTIHILLALYPIVLTVGGDIRPDRRTFPMCLLLLLAMAAVLYPVNLIADTNFMFLLYPEDGSPLLWFQEHWGHHLLGYPVILAGVLVVMSLPTCFLKRESSRIYRG